jgi:hypothetical protein
MKKGEGYVGMPPILRMITDVGAATAPPAEGHLHCHGGVKPFSRFHWRPGCTGRIGQTGALDEVRPRLPDVMAGYDGSDDAKERAKMRRRQVAHCEKMRYRLPLEPCGQRLKQARECGSSIWSSYAVYPWVKIAT